MEKNKPICIWICESDEFGCFLAIPIKSISEHGMPEIDVSMDTGMGLTRTAAVRRFLKKNNILNSFTGTVRKVLSRLFVLETGSLNM